MAKKSKTKPACPKCGNKNLTHLHDTAYGMPETHMGGSERYECGCGMVIYSTEGTRLGFKFVLDK